MPTIERRKQAEPLQFGDGFGMREGGRCLKILPIEKGPIPLLAHRAFRQSTDRRAYRDPWKNTQQEAQNPL